jgi:DNA-binding NarL/FixJ family response regulator
VSTRLVRQQAARPLQTQEPGSAAKTTILIADDHDAVREGVKSALRDSPEFVVIGEATDAAQALELLREKQPAIVILDISLPDRSGIDVAADILHSPSSPSSTRIVVYTMHGERGFVARMMKIGASAYVLKGEPLANLISALREVRDGGQRFPAPPSEEELHAEEKSAQPTPAPEAYQDLSRREREIFLMLADGRTVKEAAFELGLSPKTVETYKYRLMHKLHAENVIDLAKLAIRSHLVQP